MRERVNFSNQHSYRLLGKQPQDGTHLWELALLCTALYPAAELQRALEQLRARILALLFQRSSAEQNPVDKLDCCFLFCYSRLLTALLDMAELPLFLHL